MAADVELMQLREEEAELTARMNDASLDEGAAEPSSQDRADDEADRLTAIYDRMQVCLPAIMQGLGHIMAFMLCTPHDLYWRPFWGLWLMLRPYRVAVVVWGDGRLSRWCQRCPSCICLGIAAWQPAEG